MPLLGQQSPKNSLRACMRWLALAALGLAICTSPGLADDVTVRLRFAWGSGGQSPQKWHGKISVDGGELANLQPLGIEADEAAAIRLVGNEILAAPVVRRAFDGCDVTVRADDSAKIRVQLANPGAAEAKVVEIALAEVMSAQQRTPLDELGSYLLVHRAPGDKLRVSIDREHLVFDPGEAIRLSLIADLKAEAGESPLSLDVRLRARGSAENLWHTATPYNPAHSEPLQFELTAPEKEGVYRITIAASRPPRLANRLAPWEQAAVVASRDVELVVVDPKARLPRLSDQWEAVATIEPDNPSWWQRIPQWTQMDKLPGFAVPRPLGNVRPGDADAQGMVELPAAADGAEPTWHAYLLPVASVGEAHAVEVELPGDAAQHLAVSIVEPDAAGRVHAFGRDCGVYTEARPSGGAERGVRSHRLVFWPRTKSPAVIVANLSRDHAVRYGKIRLLRRAASPAANDAAEGALGGQPPRLVAAYLGAPKFADSFGGAEELDATSGLSVDGWHVFLTAANRLAQQLRASGYNAAIMSIAADGSSLAPVGALGSSPRYDTGMLSASGADPMRKDVLELLLRVFDREGLRLIPAIQLAAPLPGLETLKAAAADPRTSGVEWVDGGGRTWTQRYPAETALAPRYNLLHQGVQYELMTVVDELLVRYGSHSALAGLAVQLSGQGYGVLPGVGWGMDDDTARRFSAATKIELAATGDDRFQRRATMTAGPHRLAWNAWRGEQTTSLYAALAARVARDRQDRRLVLCTEDLFSGAVAAERVRQAVAGHGAFNAAFEEAGVSLERLAACNGVTLMRPRRLGDEESIDDVAVDLSINSAPEIDQALGGQFQCGELLYQTSTRVRLPSFDAQSPFGADRTYLSLNSPSTPAGSLACKSLAMALSSRDFAMLAEGGDLFPLADDARQTAVRRAFQELPVAGADMRTERRQPVTMRVYRQQESTTVCLINESPWPVEISLPLECEADLVWRQLGSPPRTAKTESSESATGGTLQKGSQAWTLKLAPYGFEARRFSSRTMRVGTFMPKIDDQARDELARRVADLRDRMQNLDVERPYDVLQNPDFERVAEDGRLVGWQPRIGKLGAVEVASEAAPEGGHSIHLASQDALGVAVQSHLFPIPATGQLVVQARLRTAGMQADAQLYAWIEYHAGGLAHQRHVPLGGAQQASEWTDCQFAADDLPLASTGQMRVQFHLVGRGEVWIDDVRLYDLRFPDDQRRKLAKRLYHAQTALDDGQLMDCQRLVEDYLPRRLVEHVPPISLAAKPAEAAAAPSESNKGFGARIRGIVPRILR